MVFLTRFAVYLVFEFFIRSFQVRYLGEMPCYYIIRQKCPVNIRVMLVIPRAEFIKLAKKRPQVKESGGFTYKAFTDQLKTTDSDVYKTAVKWLEQFCPPIQFVGEGSSRAAFCMDGCACIKVAKNKAGIEQNRHEWKICTENAKYSCFPAVEDKDDKFYSLLTECCTEATDEDFVKFFGMKAFGTVEVMQRFLRIKTGTWGWKQVAAEYEGWDDYVRKPKQKVAEGIGTGKTGAWKCLQDLIAFYESRDFKDDELLIGDLGNPQNWGLRLDVTRMEVVPVLIDAGYSEDIYQLFYRLDEPDSHPI